MGIYQPWSPEDAAALEGLSSFLCMEDAAKGAGERFALKENGVTAGALALRCTGKTGELSLCLQDSFSREILLAQTVQTLCEQAFSRGVEEIYAQIISVCEKERMVLEHAGFTLEGILRQTLPQDPRIVDFCVYRMAAPVC